MHENKYYLNSFFQVEQVNPSADLLQVPVNIHLINELTGVSVNYIVGIHIYLLISQVNHARP